MNRRIVILGFMGCGKTTVAQRLARQLACGFTDLDSFIAEQTRRSPAEIITVDGEEPFREIETCALNDVLHNDAVRIIALGGGTWTVPANRTIIALHDCLTVWIDAPFELCWKRIKGGKTIRPLAPDRESALARYNARCADYSLAEQHMAVRDSDSTEIITEQIVSLVSQVPK